MKAVKSSDYEKYGCVNCGCEYCYLDGLDGREAIVCCAECQTSFMIMNDRQKVSTVGLGRFDGFLISEKEIQKRSVTDYLSTIDFSNEEIREKLKNGLALERDSFAYPIVVPHPREGIPKHPLVIPDIRPEEGDYCYPRGVGYDLACFVKSKEAGERITEMINRVEKDYRRPPFHCRLDYREDEPLWIQVKIAYQNQLRARYLEDLINENDNVITETIVRQASNQKMSDLIQLYHSEGKKR